MNMSMRLLLALLTSACVGGVSDVQTTKNKRKANQLTLQMVRKDVLGEGHTLLANRAVLMLCQNNRCQNPLRHVDGGEFYFADHASAYNNFVAKHGIGEKIKFALVGVAVIASVGGALYLLRHWHLGKKLDKLESVIDPNKTRTITTGKKSTTGENITIEVEEIKEYLTPQGNTVSVEDYKRLMGKEDQAFIRGVTGLSTGAVMTMGLGAHAIVSSDQHWRRKQKDFQRLFMHGEKITVNKQELHSLLLMVENKMPAKTTPNVKAFIFNR